MTIGIAAAGPGAGRAILESLARLEALAEGAVGGFLSVAAMDKTGRILRAGVQRGGACALLKQGVDASITGAHRAVLMSSGPDRPDPLAQFTPGRERVGLVTGHRFPNTLGVGGKLLGESALDLAESGVAPQDACAQVMKSNPSADAGLILLDAAGRVGLADSALVARYPDAGRAEIVRDDHAVAVLHNAIHPAGSLAALVAEMVSARLAPPAGDSASIKLQSGTPVLASSSSSAVVIESGNQVTLRLATKYNGDSPWSAGLGPRVPVWKDGQTIGHATEDPFLIVKEGKLISANGMASIALPIILIEENCNQPVGHFS